MKKISMTLVVFGLLFLSMACQDNTNLTPIPDEPILTPVKSDVTSLPTVSDETPLDFTLSGLFTFYKSFLDEKI